MDSMNPICMTLNAMTLTSVLSFHVRSGLLNVRLRRWKDVSRCFFTRWDNNQ